MPGVRFSVKSKVQCQEWSSVSGVKFSFGSRVQCPECEEFSNRSKAQFQE